VIGQNIQIKGGMDVRSWTTGLLPPIGFFWHKLRALGRMFCSFVPVILKDDRHNDVLII
jgi:hypothetical protein